MRLLNLRLGEVSPQCGSQIQGLSLSQIEALGEDLLEFTTVAGKYGYSLICSLLLVR